MPYSDAVLADNPLSYWRFEETSGAILVDQLAVQNGTNGAPSRNAANLDVEGAFPGSSAIGFEAGLGQIAQIPSNAALNPSNDFTIEFWLRIDPASPAATIFSSSSVDIRFASGDLFVDIVTSGSESDTLSTFQIPVNDGQYRHIAIIYDSFFEEYVLYIDGTFEDVFIASDSISSFGNITLGNVFQSGNFIGSIDELAIYHRFFSRSGLEAHIAAANENLNSVDLAFSFVDPTTTTLPTLEQVGNLTVTFQFQNPISTDPTVNNVSTVFSFRQPTILQDIVPSFILNPEALDTSWRFFSPRVIQTPILVSTETVYVCFLENDSFPRIEIPISNFQARLRANLVSFLTVTIPNVLPILTDINDRLDQGTLSVFERTILPESFIDDLIISVLVGSVRQDQGVRANTLTLSGNSVFTVDAPIMRQLENVSQFSSFNGLRRVRADIDQHLRPGDTVEANGQSFVAGLITLNFSRNLQIMDVTELNG